jgi:HAE1 family hydrophobic/amphiphilic exporter-1
MSVGGNYGGTSNQGRAFINLKPLKQRSLGVGQIIQKLRPRFGAFPGFRVFLMAPAAIQIGGRMSKSSYDFTLQGPDTDLLYREAVKLEAEMARIPILQDVTTDLQIKTPRVNLKINRDRAATLGINSTQIEGSLYSAFGPKWSSTIYAPTNQYRVLLEIEPKYQAFTDYLSKLYFKSPDTGALIPLDSVVDQTQDASPQSVNHSGQLPSVTVSFNLKPGYSIGEAVSAVQDVAYKTLPASIMANFQGQAAAFQSSLRNLSLLLVIAIMVVFIVLGVLYESYIHPLTILSGLPAAGV